MKRWLLFFLMVVPLASALHEDLIFDGWTSSGEYFQIDNQSFRAIYIRASNTTVLYYPNGETAVIYPENSTCVEDALYKTCQYSQKFLKGTIEVPPDINEANINITLQLKIWKSESGINLSRVFNAENLFVGDRVEITTFIQRLGKFDLVNVTFTDTFSKDFEILNVANCQKEKNSVVWRGDLNSSRQKCTYTIIPLKNITFTNKAEALFDVFGKPAFVEEEHVFEVRNSPVKFNVSYPNNTLLPGNSYLINITASVFNDISLRNIFIDLPDGLEVVNASGWRIGATRLVYDPTDLKKDKTYNFSVHLLSKIEKAYDQDLDISYSYNQIIKNLGWVMPITYKANEFYVHLLDGDNPRVRVINPHDEVFREVKVEVENQTIEIDRLEDKRFKDNPITPLDGGRHLFRITYRTENGQIIYRNYTLGVGESTYNLPQLDLEEQEEEVEHVEEPPQQNIVIDPQVLMMSVSVLAGLILLVLIITFIRSRFSKSDLDKEIERIKKEAEEEAKK